MKRTLIEVLVFVVLAGLLAGTWWWQERSKEKALTELSEQHNGELALARQKAELWASALADGEAEGVFRAFIAGIGPSVLGGRLDTVDLALGGLLDLPGIDFVHVLRPDGKVIASSDRKVTTLGNAGPRADWALASTATSRREGETQGVTELAAPIMNTDGRTAVVWLGYRTGDAIETSRPKALTGSSEVDPAEEPVGL